MTERKKVWVVWTGYYDGPTVEAMRVFESEQRAAEEVELWRSLASTNVQVRECEIWG